MMPICNHRVDIPVTTVPDGLKSGLGELSTLTVKPEPDPPVVAKVVALKALFAEYAIGVKFVTKPWIGLPP
jgi:hypothetical protein